MSNWGKVEPVHRIVGGKFYKFKSKLEMRWAVWLQLQKEQGIILDWWYEDEVVPIEYNTGRIDFYRPDFTVERDTDFVGFEYHETKGWFQAKDKTKMKLFAEQYENPLTLIFAGLSPTAKSHRAQYNRAKRLEKLLESNGGRVIFDAQKTIFKPIRHLF